MTDFIKKLGFTVPANTPVASPVNFTQQFGDCIVEHIIIDFPPGLMGNVGIQVLYNQTPMYPSDAGQFAVFDSYTWGIPVTNQPTTGRWGLKGFNTDSLDHVVRAYFYCNYLRGNPVQSSSSMISL